MKTITMAVATFALAVGCAQAQDGSLTSFDGLIGRQTLDTDGDVEMNGAALSLSGRIGGWAELNGGAVEVDARIGGDLEINGGAVDVDGSVGGATLINGGAVELSGAFSGPVELNAGAAELAGDFADGLVIRAGSLEFAGEARGLVEIHGSGRERNWRGQMRADESEVEINGRLPEGAQICAHEVRFGPDAAFGGPIEVRADSQPEFAAGVDASLVNFTDRVGAACE